MGSGFVVVVNGFLWLLYSTRCHKNNTKQLMGRCICFNRLISLVCMLGEKVVMSTTPKLRIHFRIKNVFLFFISGHFFTSSYDFLGSICYLGRLSSMR